MGGGVLGWGVPSTSSKLLSHSPALTHELLTELAPASLFQMLMTSSAESLKLGHAIQPVVFGEALLMLETVVSPLPPPPSPPGLLCAAVIGTDVPLASHRATFPLIATLYVDSFHLPQQLPLSPFSSLPLQFSPTLSYTFSFSLHHSPDLCEMAFPDAPQISPSPDPDCLNVELWRWRKARREGDGRTEGVKRGQGDFFVCVIWEWVKKGKGKKKGIWARLSLLQLERIWNIIPL